MTKEDPETNAAYRLAWGVPSKGEHRWPASLAIIAAMALYLTLPHRYTIGARWIMPLLELAILIPLSISSPRREAHEGKLQRLAATVMIAIVNIANFASLVLLVNTLIFHGAQVTGTELIFSSAGIWLTNVLVFALWYWELDRGGPDERAHYKHQAPDFLFPQMSTPGCAELDWSPRFVDYLYVAFTNATAFSPTDVMPLTPTAKALMLSQSAISLITITLVAARAVKILS